MRKSKDKVVQILRDDIECVEKIMPVLVDFANIEGKNIYVANPHSSSRRPFDGDAYDLCIYFWCCPATKDYGSRRLDYAYLYELEGGQRDCFDVQFDDDDYVKILDTEGIVVALVAEKTLYILFDLPHNDDNFEAELLKLILNDYALFLHSQVDFENEMKTRMETSTQTKFEFIFRRTLNGKKYLKDLEKIDKSINEYRTEIASKARDRRIILEKRKNLDGERGFCNQVYVSNIYTQLCNLSDTGAIEVNDEGITIPVGQIDIEEGGEIYDIGKFDVVISIKEIRCINRTRTVSGYYHPHINGDGSCCFGTASYGIGLLLGDMDYAVLVAMAVEFLKTYYAQGSYKKIDNWPRRTE